MWGGTVSWFSESVLPFSWQHGKGTDTWIITNLIYWRNGKREGWKQEHRWIWMASHACILKPLIFVHRLLTSWVLGRWCLWISHDCSFIHVFGLLTCLPVFVFLIGMANLSGKKSLNTVTLVFKLPYYTQWGQSLLIAGSEPALGSWNVKQGLSLSPVHQGNELIWSGRVSVATGFTCQYNYYVVDDNKNVLRSESGEKRKLVLPEGVQDGDVVEIRDWWQVLSKSFMY